MPKLVFAMWIVSLALAIFVSPCAAEQDATTKQNASRSAQMDMGVLAVVADRRGTLFVDGEARTALIPGKVVTLKLTAGQHFVDLRDAKGAKVWEKVVSVPVGAQVAEKIDLSTDLRETADSPPRTNPEISSVVLRPPVKRFEEYVAVGFPLILETKDTAERQVRECEAHACGGEDKFIDAAAKSWARANSMAPVLYVLGRYGESLHYADENIEYQERTFDSQYSLEFELESISEAYSLRAHIRHALSDENGALADLNAAFAYLAKYRQVLPGYIQKVQKSNPTSIDSATAFQRQANRNEQALHLYRAITLMSMRRFEEAMADANAAGDIKASTIRLEIQLAMIKDPGVPAPTTQGNQFNTAGGLSQQVRAILLSGEWFCEDWCHAATISVTGNMFSAQVEHNPPDGWTCNSPNGCIYSLTGTIDGLTIEGVKAQNTLARDNKSKCDVRENNHRFHGTILDEGKRIVIDTEADTINANWHNSSTWKWQKPNYVCDAPTLEHTEPLMLVLRSKDWNGVSGPAAIRPMVSVPGSGISSQVDEIARSGRFTALPTAQSVVVGGSQQPKLSIKNQTAYELTVLIAGPVERSLSIPAGASQSVVVPPGTYRVAGQVKSSNVLPFFGTQAYATGSSYEESFYVK